MQKRPLGRTGAELSVIGFGGIVVRDTAPAEAADLVARAIDCGINYFDVAPAYGGTRSEAVLGRALRGILRRSRARRCGDHDGSHDEGPRHHVSLLFLMSG